MKQHPSNYLSKRVLRLNMGFLLSEGPARLKTVELDLPGVRVDDDLFVEYVRGTLRLSRTKEGILVQGQLEIGISGDCYRCLETVDREVLVDLAELYVTDQFIAADEAEFHISEDGQLDLAPLIRAEVLIKTTLGIRCEDEDACDERMRTLNADAGLDDIDPRMAKLKELLNSDNE